MPPLPPSNDALRDLLEPKNDNLQLHEDKARGVYIEGVKELTLKRADEAAALIGAAVRGRAVGSTLMNADSSRSHLVVHLTVESRGPSHSEAGGAVFRTGKARRRRGARRSCFSAPLPGGGGRQGLLLRRRLPLRHRPQLTRARRSAAALFVSPPPAGRCAWWTWPGRRR